MGNLFGGGGSDLPKPAPPPAIPEVGIETEDEAKRKVRGRQGFRSAFLTGDLAPETNGSTVLG